MVAFRTRLSCWLASIYNSDTQPGWLPFGGAYKGSQWPLSHLLESAISKKPCCFKKSPKFLIDSWCRPQKSLLGGSEHFLHLKTTKPCRLISTFQSHWTFHTVKLFCFNCLHFLLQSQLIYFDGCKSANVSSKNHEVLVVRNQHKIWNNLLRG